MNLPCEVVRDLLPLYHDGVCSEASKELIRKHLEGCETCKKLLQALETETKPETEIMASRPLVSVSEQWRKTTKHALLKGICCTVLIFAVLLGGFLGLTQWKWLCIETVNMEVAEIYQLKDGRILYKLGVPDGVWSRKFVFEDREDGTCYLIPKRSIIELNEQQGWDSLLDGYLMIDVAENNAWASNNGGVPRTKYCIGDPDSSNPLLIWEEGMVLPSAPAVLEEIYG